MELKSARRIHLVLCCAATLAGFAHCAEGEEFNWVAEDYPSIGAMERLPNPEEVPTFSLPDIDLPGEPERQDSGAPVATKRSSASSWFAGSRIPQHWLDQPINIAVLSGGMQGNDPIANRVRQTDISVLAALSIGWDFSQYLGTEKRIGYAALQLANESGPENERKASALFGEYRLLAYPLGLSNWRPYLIGGLGLAELSFRDDHAQLRRSVEFLIPFGFGIKVLHNPHFASRLELVDDLSLAAGNIATMHNVSVSAGFEFRFHAGDLLGRWH